MSTSGFLFLNLTILTNVHTKLLFKIQLSLSTENRFVSGGLWELLCYCLKLWTFLIILAATYMHSTQSHTDRIRRPLHPNIQLFKAQGFDLLPNPSSFFLFVWAERRGAWRNHVFLIVPSHSRATYCRRRQGPESKVPSSAGDGWPIRQGMYYDSPPFISMNSRFQIQSTLQTDLFPLYQ